MEVNDDNSLSKLWIAIKKYLSLQLNYAKLTATEKLAIILSNAVVLLVIFILGGLALFFLLFAMTYMIEGIIGSKAGAFLIVGCVILFLLLIVILLRKSLIMNPVARFLSKLFLNSPNKK